MPLPPPQTESEEIGQQVRADAYVRPAYDRNKILHVEIKVFARPCLQTGVIVDADGRGIVDAKGKFLADKFAKYEARMNKQIKCKFEEVRAKKTVVNEGRGLRLYAQSLDEFDEEAYNVETTNIKMRSQYHMEDCLNMHHGDAIMLYFCCDARSTIQNVFNKKPLRAGEVQLQQGIGGDIITTNAEKFIALKPTISQSTLHHDIKYGNLTPAQFKREFNGNQGFGVQFVGTLINIASSLEAINSKRQGCLPLRSSARWCKEIRSSFPWKDRHNKIEDYFLREFEGDYWQLL